MFTRKLIIKIYSKNKSKLFTEILNQGVSYEAVNLYNGSVLFTILAKDLKKYEAITNTLNLNLTIEKHLGIVNYFIFIMKRGGIAVGTAFLIIFLFLSQNFIWRINVYGNCSNETDFIKNELTKGGLRLGTYIPSINFDQLHNKILLNSKEIAWISVNIKGNVANVYIREIKNDDLQSNNCYANVVAKKDGQVAEILVIEGEKKIIIGDVVKKGDVLISGVLDSQANGVNYCKADGMIKAYTHNELVVSSNYKQEEKVYVNKHIASKQIKILEKNITFFKKSNKTTLLYDKIELNKRIAIFNIDNLPFFLSQTVLFEYELIERELSKEQAVDKAFIELRKQLDLTLKDAELISKDIKIEYTDTGVTIRCNLYCLENIAKVQEFSKE